MGPLAQIIMFSVVLCVTRSSKSNVNLYGHPSMCIELCAFIAHRSAWLAMKKCISRLEGNDVVSNCTNLNRVSNIKFFLSNQSANMDIQLRSGILISPCLVSQLIL